MIVLFEKSERSIGEVRPSVSVALIGDFRSGHQIGQVARAHSPPISSFFGKIVALSIGSVFHVASTVVDGEKGKGVLQLIRFEQMIDYLTDHLVHEGNLGGVDFHSPFLPSFVRFILPSRDIGMAGRENHLWIDDPELFHPLKPFFSEDVPTGGEFAFVRFDCLVGGMQRPMGRSERQVEKEGLVPGDFLEKGDGFPANCMGEVVFAVIDELVVDGGAVSFEPKRSEETTGPSQDAIKVIEASLIGKTA